MPPLLPKDLHDGVIKSVLSRGHPETVISALDGDVAESRCGEPACSSAGIEGNEDVTNVQFPHPFGVDGIGSQEAASGAQHPEGFVQYLILQRHRRHVVKHRQAHNRREMTR